MGRPLVFEIKGNSLDDGPGIRTVVFFKGCPLSCQWCHNPESKKLGSELSFEKGLCIGCGTCFEVCQKDAINFKDPLRVDRNNCNLCFECVKVCPSKALSQVGEALEIGEIFEAVIKDKPFFENSNGGVTLSGGEPLLHMTFISQLLKKFKEAGLNTLIETSGFFNWEIFREKILPYTDTIYMDLKIYDGKEHRHYCGRDNKLILENFTKLSSKFHHGQIEVLPRIPLIPGITTAEKNIREIAAFLKKNRIKKIQLLPNNPLWYQKLLNLGAKTEVFTEEMGKWLPQEEIHRLENIVREYGIIPVSQIK